MNIQSKMVYKEDIAYAELNIADANLELGDFKTAKEYF